MSLYNDADAQSLAHKARWETRSDEVNTVFASLPKWRVELHTAPKRRTFTVHADTLDNAHRKAEMCAGLRVLMATREFKIGATINRIN